MGQLRKRIITQCLFLISIIASSIAFSAKTLEDMPIYLKSMHITADNKAELEAALARYHEADNLWDILRNNFSLPHYETIPAVQEKINWYMSNQDYLLRVTSRAAPYLYYIYQQIHERHLPAELVLLPIVESGYNPFSISNVGASGIWQLMPDTATGLGVKQDFWYDGRRDLIASTRAALNYLSYLQNFFEGRWLLAIAAYNTGEGNVLAAIKRNIRDGRNTDFWSLPVAQQTRDYVPSILALATIISHPEKYPIYFPPVRNAPYLAKIDIGTQMNLKLAAGLAGISYQRLMQLNPGFNRVTTAKQGPFTLILPLENIAQFADNFQASPLARHLPWVNYAVKTGDTLFSLARKFNMSAQELRLANHLTTDKLRPTMELLIPNRLSSKPESALALLAKMGNFKLKTVGPSVSAKKQTIAIANVIKASGKYTLQPGDTIYMIRPTDTIDGIAKRFNVNVEMIKLANHLRSNKLQSGKKLIIPTHPIMTAQGEVRKKLQPGDTIYLVRRGDTIEKIAKKYKLTSAQVRLANLKASTSLQEGERLTIPTHYTS